MRRLEREIVGICTHSYAPELNHVVLNSGFEIPTPNMKLVKEYVSQFQPATRWVRIAHITVLYTELAHKSCDRIYSVGISHGEYKEAMRQLRERHDLPDAQFIVKTVSKFI